MGLRFIAHQMSGLAGLLVLIHQLLQQTITPERVVMNALLVGAGMYITLVLLDLLLGHMLRSLATQPSTPEESTPSADREHEHLQAA